MTTVPGARGRRLVGPLLALAVALVVLSGALVLDRGPESGRDLALLLGSLALYGLVPIALVWLVIALLLRRRSRR